MSKVIYYVPVDEVYTSEWEYYSADQQMLEESGFDVIVVTGLFGLLRNLFNVEFVYCWWWGRSLIPILLCRFFSVPVYVTGAEHMFDLSGSGSFIDRKIYQRIGLYLSFRLSNLNLFISKHQKLSIVSMLKGVKGVVLYPSLTTSFLNPSLLLPYEIRKNTILCFCWMTHRSFVRKGIYDALKGFRIFLNSQEHPSNFELVVAGRRGDGLQFLYSLIEELELTEFVSVILDPNQSEKQSLFGSSICLLAPSYMEGFGNASLEAMSYATPVICSPEGASREVVSNTGLIMTDVGVSAVAEALGIFFNLPLQQRALMSNSASDRSNSFFSLAERVRCFKQMLEKR
ncbi:glycosyltransferase family 4 protein [Marinobacterium sp. LSUCC0821]|uniref:glycosyltransferase family 4 protein n=1 Tax=Marinobacterium sp. LSUCC0821 TaxID=2668067 RepID=UPI001452488B|nr:glycosyltransferase [Marinobacterium sp. LSUCC0821]QJD72179.1 glycosyltransferase [Marinobacterium sp. LSUCC0821]